MKKNLLRLVAATLALCTMMGMAACGSKDAGTTDGTTTTGDTASTGGYKDTLVWAQGADVTSLDPHQGKETPSVEVTCQIFDTLVTVDPETNEIVGQIAESWE